MIIEEYDENLFISRFEDFKRVGPNGNFSYRGLRALFEYLEETTDEENPLNLDVIALCVDFSEYKNVDEFLKDYSHQYKSFEEFLKDNYPEDLENYEQHKKEAIKSGLNLSESLFNFIAYIQEDIYKIDEYKTQLEQEISDNTTLIKFSDDLNDGFIIASY